MRNIRRLYDWVLHWGTTPYAELALFLVALTEAIFFPIPPDLLLIPMAVASPRRGLRYALITMLGSGTGGAMGYLIGALFMETIGMPIVNFYGASDHFFQLQQLYQQNAILAIAISGFTPIPYKIFTLSSGAFDIPFGLFITVSLLSRGARFFLVAGLIFLFGPKIRSFIDRYFNLLTILFVVALILGFVVVRWLV